MEKNPVLECAQRSNRPALAASPWTWLSVAIFSVLILMLSDPWSIQRSACTICPFIILAGGVGCVCAAIDIRDKRRGTVESIVAIVLCMLPIGVGIAVIVDAVMIPSRGQAARQHAARVQLQELREILATFKDDVGRYPTTSEALAALMNPPSAEKRAKKQYVPRIPLDPWGNEYVYRCPGVRGTGPYDLGSLGPDGVPSADDLWAAPPDTP